MRALCVADSYTCVVSVENDFICIVGKWRNREAPSSYLDTVSVLTFVIFFF